MAKDDRPRIGRQLRRAMEKARLNQNDIAAALGVSRNAVNAWMNDRAYPMNSLAALEELLGVTFADDDEAPPRDRSESPMQALDRLQRELDGLRKLLRERGQGNDEGGADYVRRAI
jgi:transcriptional regulator with XRE-family HTH domain